MFYGEDGLDELTTAGTSFIYRLKDGAITHAEFTPGDFGVALADRDDLLGGDAAENAAITMAILDGETGPRRDIALVNALPGIVAAGLADGFGEAMALAEAVHRIRGRRGGARRVVAMSEASAADGG